MRWWERWPGRLEYELGELDRAGIACEIDEPSLKAGIAKIQLRVCCGDEQVNLVAVFPDLYPDLRFEVFAPDLDLPHHQNPFEKNLCLIGRDTGNWRPSDTLAAFILNQFPKVLESARATDLDEVAGIEQPQAEPFSEYYGYLSSSMLLVDSSWSIDPSVPRGQLVIALESGPPTIRGAVLQVTDHEGRTLVAASDAIRRRYRGLPTVRGRWIRCDAPVRQYDASDFLRDLGSRDPKILDAEWPPLNRSGGQSVDIIGVIFPEETGWRQTGDGWVFLVRIRQKDNKKQHRALVRAGYAGLADMSARIPELSYLPQRSVAVFGLGALGMPSAIALARAGLGEMRVLDFDFADPAASTRWSLGLGAAGLSKPLVLERFVATEYPHTGVVSYDHRLGALSRQGELSDLDVIESMLDGTDLVYDATAEEGLHPLLERFAREHRIPYLCVSGTNGAWGGTIVRTRPESGCWHCFLFAQEEGHIPFPIEAPTSFIQPAGCGSPTFTGAGFDLDQISTLGVRYAVGILSPADGGDSDFDFDVAIGNFRDGDGHAILPKWEGFTLGKRRSCPACGT